MIPRTETVALERHADVHLLLHAPTSVPAGAALARKIPGIARYAERALLIAEPQDIVCVFGPPDSGHLEYLHTLGIGPRVENVISLPPPCGGLAASQSQAILDDSSLLRRIVDRVGGSCALDTFMATEDDARLADRLSRALGRPVLRLADSWEVCRRVYPKTEGRRLAQRLGLPVAPGDVVKPATPEGARTLRCSVAKHRRRTGKAIVRGALSVSGTTVFVVAGDGPGDIDQVLRGLGDDRSCLVEPCFDVAVSPNVQVHVRRTPPAATCVSITDQILDADLTYQGNRHPSNARHIDAMIAAALDMGRELGRQGFSGRAGFDFIEYRDPRTARREYAFAELNPRTNGALYPATLMARLNHIRAPEHPSLSAFACTMVATDARHFRDVETRAGELLLRPDAAKGVVPFNLGCLGTGCMGAIALGGSLDATDRLLDELRSRVTSRLPI